MKKINDIAKKHYDWIDSKGWHKSTVLESIGLIGSEIGESIQEVYDNDQEKLVLEIADIYLRCMDLGVKTNIDLDIKRLEKEEWFNNFDLLKYGKSILEQLAYLTIPFAKLANTGRYEVLPKEFEDTLVTFMLSVEKICEINKIDLFETVEIKMDINLKKDHKNRIK
jgi:NTP pyrophosphatase (non-canonical NTP hydrolase)